MPPANTLEILASCGLLGRVDPPARARVARIAQIRAFAAGETIFNTGDPCPGIFIVGSGLVRVFKLAASGKEHVLHLVGPGGTFAEVAAIGKFDCPASAQALEATTCVLLPGAEFNRMLEADHALCLQLLWGMTRWVRHLVGLTEDIALRDAAGRLARYLLEAREPATGMIRLPSLKRHLASHLNLTSETLSRTFRRLSEAGFIEEQSNQELRVLDAEALRGVADGMYPRL